MRFNWIDNPTISGSVMDPDVLNDCLMHLKYANSPVSNNYIFDIKVTDRILDEDESLGWALQGSYIDSSYTEAINKIKKELTTIQTVSKYAGTDYEFDYQVAKNGHRIVDISFKAAVDKLFNEKGIADFYIFDSENNHLYLPRNNWFMQLTTDINRLNEYIPPGIPDHWHYVDEMPNTKNRPRGDDRTNCTTYYETKKTRNASECNPIYGASDSVQPPSSLKLLYYFVGVN